MTTLIYTVCSDSLLRPVESGVWVLFNPRVHRHVQIDDWTMSAIMRNSSGKSKTGWIDEFSEGQGWVRSDFTNRKGLMTDPTGCGPISSPVLTGKALFEALKNAWILHCSDGADYEEFLAPKTSLLDDNHLGTFHQILGCYQLLTLRLRKNWRWWHDQKFTPDGLNLLPGFYQWIQGYFFKSYFGAMALKGEKILDFACGNGFYSNQFQSFGAEVWGVDPSRELIEIAKKNYGEKIKFFQPENEQACEGFLAQLPEASFDRIYLSDALLFFFYDLKSPQERSQELDRLLKNFRRIIKPDGVFHLMEPNGTFWLSSWIGGPPRPMAIITEYRERLYHVAPTTDKVVNALTEAGFLISNLIHPDVDPAVKTLDPMAYAFAKAFPLWDFYCSVPAP